MADKETPAKPMVKTAVYKELASKAGLEPKQVAAVFEALEELILGQLGKKGPGVFQIPGLVKFNTIKKPATKATTKPNPFKPGEMMEVKAKPASTKVKVRALKSLKEL
ncbi:MAG: HU family DNA-binding protein, partial [Gemmataceae bacterium]|nr:HU family DNA-binding protein [Gemmataceae bacterium]